MQLHLNSLDTDQLVQKQFALLDFGAPWCRLCRMLHPLLNRLAAEWHSELSIITIDVDNQWEVARRYGIRSLPTLLLLEDGVEVQRLTGFRNREDVLQQCKLLLNRYLPCS